MRIWWWMGKREDRQGEAATITRNLDYTSVAQKKRKIFLAPEILAFSKDIPLKWSPSGESRVKSVLRTTPQLLTSYSPCVLSSGSTLLHSLLARKISDFKPSKQEECPGSCEGGPHLHSHSDTEDPWSHTEKHHETTSVQQGPFLWILPWDMLRINVYVCRIHKQFKTIIVDILLWSLPFLQWERNESWVLLMSNLKSKGHAHTLHKFTGRYWLFYFHEGKGRVNKTKKQRRAQGENGASEHQFQDKHNQAQGTNKQEIWNSRISLLIPIASRFCLNEKLFMYTTNDKKERTWALKSEAGVWLSYLSLISFMTLGKLSF